MPALQIIFWLFLEVILISHLHFLLSFKTSFFSERSTKALQKSPWVVSFQNSLLDHHVSSISEVKFAILPTSPWDIRRKIITFSSSMINRDVGKMSVANAIYMSIIPHTTFQFKVKLQSELCLFSVVIKISSEFQSVQISKDNPSTFLFVSIWNTRAKVIHEVSEEFYFASQHLFIQKKMMLCDLLSEEVWMHEKAVMWCAF